MWLSSGHWQQALVATATGPKLDPGAQQLQIHCPAYMGHGYQAAKPQVIGSAAYLRPNCRFLAPLICVMRHRYHAAKPQIIGSAAHVRPNC